MALTNTPICDFGQAPPDFALRGVDGRDYSLEQCRAANGLLVMFICNHCPYVQAMLPRLLRDARTLSGHGVGSVAVMPNDTESYPEDGFEKMRELSIRMDFPFPYLLDAEQTVARAYGAVCTPDFFGYNASLELQYRGRLDVGRLEAPPEDAPRELLEAMLQVARTGRGPRAQVPSSGCSIKWRT